MNEEPTQSELEAFLAFRTELAQSAGESGIDLGRRLSDLADSALAEIARPYEGVAVLAVGGYGRRELCLYSDIDVMLLHAGPAPEAAVRSILYPLWDAAVKVGHATRTVKATLAFAREDHNTLCSLLSARMVSGPSAMLEELDRGLRRLFVSMRGTFTERLAAEERKVWEKEPFALQNLDVKNGRGGLRSLHRLSWDRRRSVLLGEAPVLPDSAQEEYARRTLIEVRQALHGVERRAGDIFQLDLRGAVGAWLGQDPHGLATEVYQAARTVDGLAARRWSQVRPAGTDPLAHAGLAVVQLVRSRWSRRAPMTTPLAFATSAAASHSRGLLSAWEHDFASRAGAPDWQAGDRAGLVGLLAAGADGWQAILGLWEAGWMTRALPEIAHLRGLSQAAPFHLHPADAHLGATVANAVELAGAGQGWLGEVSDQIGSLDEVLLAAFLHDIGKGLPGDHSENGSRLVTTMLTRLGFPTSTITIVSGAVRHHLLLSETAARHDIEDPEVVQKVARVVGNLDQLRILTLLTASDARATGPDMWTPWKETLLRRLVTKLELLLAGTSSELEGQLIVDLEGRLPNVAPATVREHLRAMPSGYLARFGPDLAAEHLRLITPPPTGDEVRTAVIAGAPMSTLIVATVDRPGLLATIAGVVSLRNLNVLEARAVTRTDGLAIDTFRVEDSLGSDMVGQGRWPGVRDDLAAAIRGRLDLEEMLRQKRSSYPQKHKVSETVVRVDGRYIDVRTHDRIGLLHDLAAAMSNLRLDVKLAKIDTRAGEAIDVFEFDNPQRHSGEFIRAHLLRTLGS